MTDAKPIPVSKDWEDLKLDADVRRKVTEIVQWEAHGVALFIGEAGTTRDVAAVIAKKKGCPAYRADLSKLVSKQVDETKVNLDRVFGQAAEEHALLLLDGIERAFAERGAASAQQRAYLLQRIQDYPGVVVIATNMRALADEAFARRFQSVVLFPAPSLRKGG